MLQNGSHTTQISFHSHALCGTLDTHDPRHAPHLAGGVANHPRFAEVRWRWILRPHDVLT